MIYMDIKIKEGHITRRKYWVVPKYHHHIYRLHAAPSNMAASKRLLRTALFLLIFNRCLAWDNDELELFDLVEEVNANFYDVLGVGQVMLCYFS